MLPSQRGSFFIVRSGRSMVQMFQVVEIWEMTQTRTGTFPGWRNSPVSLHHHENIQERIGTADCLVERHESQGIRNIHIS
ncbi:hypothetical protein FKM82_002530 [Ascaphus truei]